MIVKGNQRGGGQQLATHLLNACDNEEIELAEITGAVAGDLHGALAEWRAVAEATRCKKYLYSLSINPDPAQPALSRDQVRDFIARVEDKLGLAGQPRATVFHEKDGREHAHVVWSRITWDPAKEKFLAVHMPFDRQQLRTIVRAFARDHGITLPEKMRDDQSLARTFGAAAADHREVQQARRTGITRDERVVAVTQAWRESESPWAFVTALNAHPHGYVLARGDGQIDKATGKRRGDPTYVLIDRYGDIHALRRCLTGVKAAQIKARLGAEFPLSRLPGVAEVRRRMSGKDTPEKPRRPSRRQAQAQARREALAEKHKARRAPLEQQRAQVKKEQDRRLAALEKAHARENRYAQRRYKMGAAKGMLGMLERVSGLRAFRDKVFARQQEDRRLQQFEERDQLVRHYENQFLEIGRHLASLSRIEAYETGALETRLLQAERQLSRRLEHGPAPALALRPRGRRAVPHKAAKRFTSPHREIARPVTTQGPAAPKTVREKFGEAGALSPKEKERILRARRRKNREDKARRESDRRRDQDRGERDH